MTVTREATGGRVQSLERSLDLLAALADGPKTLTQVVKQTGLPKGTVHRLLSALSYRDLAIKDPTENVYLLGPGFLRLIQGSVETVGAMTLPAQTELAKLRDRCGETVILHVRMAMARVCIEELPSPEAIRYTAEVGSVAPLHVGSASKVLLAFAGEDERDRLLSKMTLTAYTDGTITDIDVLRREIELTAERGWAASSGERVGGASAISVPVIGAQDTVFSLSVLGPSDRWTQERRLKNLDDIKETADAVSVALGGSPIGKPKELKP